MLAFAGLVLVWSGDMPIHETHRIPPEGLVLGRDHADASDAEISRAHARFAIEGDLVVVTDLGSRNGTHVNGRRMALSREAPMRSPAVIRLGQTVAVLVGDVRPYEHVPVSRYGKVVVAGSLDRPVRAIETALEHQHVAIVGCPSLGRELALAYARKKRDHYLEIDTSDVHATTHVATTVDVGTIVVRLGRPLIDRLAIALERRAAGGVHCAVVVAYDHALDLSSLVKPGTTRVVELPRYRFDELPSTLADLAHQHARGVEIHATAIEKALLLALDVDEDRLLSMFQASLVRALNRSTRITGDDLAALPRDASN